MIKYLDVIESVLRDSGYGVGLFSDGECSDLWRKVFVRTVRGKDVPYVRCVVRDKDVPLRADEIIRQLYARRLIEGYGYPRNRLGIEYPVNFGREKKRADIVIFDRYRFDVPYIVVEIKRNKERDGKDQLLSYCNATGATIGVWTNGNGMSHYHHKGSSYFEGITDIPGEGEGLEDILHERFTLKDLILRDKVANERKSLKDIILDMEDDVLANAGVDVFEEVFKLIFTKLYDEYKSRDDKGVINNIAGEVTGGVVKGVVGGDAGYDYGLFKDMVRDIDDSDFRCMEFRNTGQTDAELKSKIGGLFCDAQEEWPGVFSAGSVFELSDNHLSVCVSCLQDVKLFNSNLLVVDEAFEYLVIKSAKGEKGQYFTPRHVIDMCVRMLNPLAGEYMIDTASGSCGFPLHTIFKLTGHLFSNVKISDEERENVLRVFGIEFDGKVVRVARMLNLIVSGGETNVLHLNTLDYERWNDAEKNSVWVRDYGNGFDRLKMLCAEGGQNRRFNFDILMANPPFAGDIKESRILYQYEFGFKSDGKVRNKVGRDILFLERNLDFLKPGGRMAIVLPQGRFNNTTDKYVREFIIDRARILAVVGLHVNTFKPHTGTKTSVLFVQKWDDDLCPRVDDYPIFFAVSEKSGKDGSGDYVYLKNENGENKLDRHGHLIVDHDLHNHDGELSDGVAEIFVDWAKKEGLSFWQ